MDEKEQKSCPACDERRMHTIREWRDFHPYAGHGVIDGKPTHPDLTVAELKQAS